jgi:hypothetical protein
MDLKRSSFSALKRPLMRDGRGQYVGKYCMNETSYGQSCIGVTKA